MLGQGPTRLYWTLHVTLWAVSAGKQRPVLVLSLVSNKHGSEQAVLSDIYPNHGYLDSYNDHNDLEKLAKGKFAVTSDRNMRRTKFYEFY